MTKSNNPRMTLLHYLVEEAQSKNKDALSFVDDLLEPLQKASRFTMETITVEFNQLKKNVTQVQRKVQNTPDEVKQQFSGFLEEAVNDLDDVEEAIDRIKKLSKRLSEHYCENERTFNLDQFLESFREFCEKVKTVQQEFETQREQLESAERRRKAHEEMLERRRSGSTSYNNPVVNKPVVSHPVQDRKIVDNIVNEIRRGKVLRRLSLKKKGVTSLNIHPVPSKEESRL